MRTPPTDIRKPDCNLPEHAKILMEECPEGRWVNRTISIFTENKIKPSNKRTPSLQSNMEVVQ